MHAGGLPVAAEGGGMSALILAILAIWPEAALCAGLAVGATIRAADRAIGA